MPIVLKKKMVKVLESTTLTKKFNEAIDLERENYVRIMEGKKPLPVDEKMSVKRVGFGSH